MVTNQPLLGECDACDEIVLPPSSQGNTLFTCYVCDRTFPSSEELTQHQPTHSKDDKPFKCVHCKESFKTFSEVSMRSNTGNTFITFKTKCIMKAVLFYTFFSPPPSLQLTAHRRQLCPERQFVCKDCNETFRSVGLLRTHRLTRHPRQDADTPEQLDDAPKSHQCKKCSQGFETETELVAHQEKCGDGQQCDSSAQNLKKRGRPSKPEEQAAPAAAAEKKGKRKKKEEVETPEEAEKAASPPAEEKGKAGGAKRGRPAKAAAKPDAENKKNPEEENQEEDKEKKAKADPAASRQHPCTECDLGFPTLVQLRAHKKEKHAARKAHPCEECEESFARQEQLDAHMSRAHAVGRFACSTCGKSFGRERTLKAHEKSHAEEKAESAKR